MKNLKVLLITLIILITSISANAVTFVQNYDWAPFYYEKVTIATDAVSRLNQTYREDSKGIFLTVETNSIRFRIDGGDPDANDGHVVIAGGNVYLIDSKSVRNLRMIAVGGTATYLTSATPLLSVNPIFADPDITTPLSTTKPDLTLHASSTAIDGGINLTTVQVDDIGSGTSLIVTDASYFQDGTWGSDLARSSLHADWICVGATIGAATCLQISAINYETNTITVADFTRADGDYVWLYKKSDGTQVLYGTAPDYGAHEYVLGNSNSTMTGVYNAKGMAGAYNAKGMVGAVSN